MRERARRRLRGARARPGRARPNSEYAPPSGQDRRAISVQLARVIRGQPRVLPAARIGRSAPLSAVTVPLPKLTVRVRFVWVCAAGPCHDVPARLRTTGTLEGEVERGHPVRCARLVHAPSASLSTYQVPRAKGRSCPLDSTRTAPDTR